MSTEDSHLPRQSCIATDRLPDDYLEVVGDAIELSRIRINQLSKAAEDVVRQNRRARTAGIEAYQTADGGLRLLGPEGGDIECENPVDLAGWR